MLQKILAEFQIDIRMEKQMRTLFGIVLKVSVVNVAKTAYMLTQVDIENKDNQLSCDSIELGTKVKQMLTKMGKQVCLDSDIEETLGEKPT